MARVLLINPSYAPSYGGSKASIVNPILPTLGLATIAAVARARGHRVEILDLSYRPYDYRFIEREIRARRPDVIGITATTPLMNQLRDITVLAREISKDIVLVGGGPHPSAMPEGTLRESLLDVVVTGEGDYSFADICDGMRFADIDGVVYRDGDDVVATPRRAPIANLDDMPFPAWELYDVRVYRKHMSRLLARRPPVAMMEFSRGCVFKCDFCASKQTMALGYRKKSPERCAEEAHYLRSLGFREFNLADDIFTSDQKWAVAVSEAMIRKKTDIVWTCTNGIRVESANDDMFRVMREAGCYRVAFGFESGNDEVLKKFGKGGRASIEKGKRAVQRARAAGLDTSGFFLLGLSPDDAVSMNDTIEYARQLPLDMLKFGLTIAFPGTPMFDDYARKGLIRSWDWDEYFIYSDEPLFAHERLSFDDIKRTMDEAYRKAILFNPAFVWRRFKRGIKTREFFWDAYYASKFYFMPSRRKTVASSYFARDRWPTFDHASHLAATSDYPIVRKIGRSRVGEASASASASDAEGARAAAG